MNRIQKMLCDGYTIFDTCYESADKAVEKAKAKGYSDVRAYRVKTDTPGLKMFIILVKERSQK